MMNKPYNNNYNKNNNNNNNNYNNNQNNINNNNSNKDPKGFKLYLAYYKGTPQNLTSRKCLESINRFCKEKLLSTRCLSVCFKKDDKNDDSILNSVEDVQNLINKIQSSIDYKYFQIPEKYKDQQQQFRIKSEPSEGQNKKRHQVEEEEEKQILLKKFVTSNVKQSQQAKEQEEQQRFNSIEKFLKTLVNEDYYNDEDQDDDQDNSKDNQNNPAIKLIHLYGPENEIKDLLHNAKIFYNVDKIKQAYYFLQTKHEQKNNQLQMLDEKHQKDAAAQYEQQMLSQNLSQVTLGFIFQEQETDLKMDFYEIYKIDRENKPLNSMTITFTDDESQSQKRQSIAIQFEYKRYYVKLEFPYLYCNSIYKSDNKYYFELVVPPKYYVRVNESSQLENIDPKKNKWIRVDNFYARNISNELARIEFTNNTIIEIQFNEKSDSEEFQRMLKKQFSTIYKDNKLIIVKNINFFSALIQDQSRNQFQQFNQKQKLNFHDCWQKLLDDYQFNLSYTILTLVSHNKLSAFIMDQFLTYLDEKKKQNFSEFIIEKAIVSYYNKSSPQKRFSFKEEFGKILSIVSLQENQLKLIEENQKKNIKIIASRRVSITPSGLIYNLKEYEMSNRVMRLFQEQSDQFIRGIFQDDSLENAKHMRYVSRYFRQILEKFNILKKQYINFGWSASQLRSCSSWFFNETPQLSKSDVIVRIGDFSSITPAAKKSARIGQCFSSSTPYRFKKIPKIEFLEDIETPCYKELQDENGNVVYTKNKPKVFTDGIGTISKDILKQISDHLGAFFMSAIQIRYGGAKGVLCVNEDTSNTIQLRPSMLKYKVTDRVDEHTIDILDRNKYRYGYLNRQVIILLKSLGIEDKYFIEAQNQYINNLKESALKDANIFTLFNNDYSKDGTKLLPITHLLRLMQSCNLDMNNDIFCQGVVHTLKKRGFYILRKKSNIYLKDSARLMGVIDEFGVLEPNEVFAYISQDDDNTFFQIQGDVIVVKNPCLHPGDIRKLKAVSLDTIQKRLGGDKVHNPFRKLRNILIFPQKGDEPVTAQIAGSDLDGDCYFICWDKRFIPEIQKKAFNYDEDDEYVKTLTEEEVQEIKEKQKNKAPLTFYTNNPIREDVNDKSMLDFFIDFINNENLVFADRSERYAEDDRCIRLAALHSKAVDYAKTGTSPSVPPEFQVEEYPDFMEKDDKPSYESSSILGILYRDVKQQYEENCRKNIDSEKNKTHIDNTLLFNPNPFINENLDTLFTDIPNLSYLEQEIQFAIKVNNEWNIQLDNLKGFFGAQDEFEIYTGNFSKLIKVERKKKMSAEIVQQRIISTLINLKNRFELLFFTNHVEDKEIFYEETNKRKYYSKKCKVRATIWHIICLLRQPAHVEEYYLKYSEEQTSLLAQIFTILKKEEYGINLVRGNQNPKFFNNNNNHVGLSWFIFGEVLLEIKKSNDQMEQYLKDKSLIEHRKQQQQQNNQENPNKSAAPQTEEVCLNFGEEGYISDEYF